MWSKSASPLPSSRIKEMMMKRERISEILSLKGNGELLELPFCGVHHPKNMRILQTTFLLTLVTIAFNANFLEEIF